MRTIFLIFLLLFLIQASKEKPPAPDKKLIHKKVKSLELELIIIDWQPRSVTVYKQIDSLTKLRLQLIEML